MLLHILQVMITAGNRLKLMFIFHFQIKIPENQTRFELWMGRDSTEIKLYFIVPVPLRIYWTRSFE